MFVPWHFSFAEPTFFSELILALVWVWCRFFEKVLEESTTRKAMQLRETVCSTPLSEPWLSTAGHEFAAALTRAKNRPELALGTGTAHLPAVGEHHVVVVVFVDIYTSRGQHGSTSVLLILFDVEGLLRRPGTMGSSPKGAASGRVLQLRSYSKDGRGHDDVRHSSSLPNAKQL
jgi:hypothetical protein